MRVDNNITIFAGAANQPAAEETEQKQRKTLFAGDMGKTGNTIQDRIAQKREEAQKQAMKVVGDAFAGEAAIDEDMESRRNKVEELKAEGRQLQEEANGLLERGKSLEQAYEDGEVAEADYIQEKGYLAEAEKSYNQKIGENKSSVLEENAIIRGTRLERLKTHSMADAWKEADDVMEAAGQEIVGMVVEDAKEKLEEESEKREEQAAEIKEEKEKQEELIEKQTEKREEMIAEDMPVEEIVSLDSVQSDVKQEVQNIVDKMKLLAEDIKGAAVDEMV